MQAYVKTRKEYRCNICGAPILYGTEAYINNHLPFEEVNGMSNQHTCMICAATFVCKDCKSPVPQSLLEDNPVCDECGSPLHKSCGTISEGKHVCLTCASLMRKKENI